MFQKYKEILFGLAFGVGAVVIDTSMDAMANGNSMIDEVVEHPGVLFYRSVFIVFGLILGWLLWQNSRRERETRQLAETLSNVRKQCGARALLLGTKLQMLLTRDDLHLSEEASRLLQDAYAKSQDLQRIAEEDSTRASAKP